MDRDPLLTPRERLRGLIARSTPSFIAICLLTAIAASRYLSLTNADALLPSLMSTQHWTLFYWGQDRLANLVPLIAMPVRDPLWNFRVQSVLIGGSFFALIAMLVSFHLSATGRRVRPATHALITLAAGLLVMAPMKSITGYRFVFEQLYGVSVLLFLLGAAAWIRRRSFLVGAGLVQVAMLVNPSLLLATPIMLLLDDRVEGRVRRLSGLAAVAAGAFVVTGFAADAFATGPAVDAPYDRFTLGNLRSGTEVAGRNIAHSMHPALAVVLAVACVAVVSVRGRRLTKRSGAVYIAVPVFSALWFVAFSTNGWVEQNLHEFRYFYPLYITYMLFVAGATVELLTSLATRAHRWSSPTGRSTVAPWVIGGLVAPALPLIAATRADIAWLSSAEDGVVAARRFDAEFVVGNYWHTWPVVIAGRADGMGLLGVTFRSDPILEETQARLDVAEEQHRSIRVLCLLVDAQTCSTDFVTRAGREWTITRTLSAEPLVVEMRPLDAG